MASRYDPRKTAQLCTQIRRAIELGVLSDPRHPLFADLEILAVEPAPDDRRLRVVFALHGEGHDPATATAELEAAKPLFLHEVAHSINRRKTPDLAFVVQPAAAEG